MSCRLLLPTLLLILLCLLPCLHGRKLLAAEHDEKVERLNTISSPLDLNLLLTALPKERVPPSSPSKKGHSMAIDQKLLSMHYARLDRILKSVPSPGVGH